MIPENCWDIWTISATMTACRYFEEVKSCPMETFFSLAASCFSFSISAISFIGSQFPLSLFRPNKEKKKKDEPLIMEQPRPRCEMCELLQELLGVCCVIAVVGISYKSVATENPAPAG